MVILTAATFGFGPASALHATLSANPGRLGQDDLVVLPDQLLPLFDDLPTLPLIAGDANSVAALCASLREPPDVANFGNLDLLLLGLHSRRHVLIDCVGWLTPKLLRSLELPPSQRFEHVVEYFPPTNPEHLPSGAKLAQPALPLPPPQETRTQSNHVVICLGGGCFPGQQTYTTGLERVAENLASALTHDIPSVDVYVTGGAAGFVSGASQAVPLAHGRHLDLIRTSRLVITVPGLYTLFECWRLRVPVLLLPPTNYTQLVQFYCYLTHGLVHPLTQWQNLLDLPPADADVGHSSAEASITRSLRQLLNSPGSTAVVSEKSFTAASGVLRNGAAPLYSRATALFLDKFCRTDLPSIGDLIWRSCGY